MSRALTKFGMLAVCLFSVLLLVVNVFAQETTGGLQGTVKDPSGAVVAKAARGTDRHLSGGRQEPGH